MPSLRLSEIDELMLEDDELNEIQLRRKKRKEKKERILREHQLEYKETGANGFD